MSLTPKQMQFINFIEEFTEEHGYAPSQWEIAKHFGYKSLGTVQDHIQRLKQKGYLKKKHQGQRSLTLKAQKHHIPLLGRVAAGSPIEAILHQESIEVPSSMLKGMQSKSSFFALEVRGDSMIEDGILNGDQVIIRKQDAAENGDTVVALINHEATIKRFYKKEGQVELHAANPSYQTIYIDDDQPFSIAGVLVGVIRHTH